jgi:hypothetical protein
LKSVFAAGVDDPPPAPELRVTPPFMGVALPAAPPPTTPLPPPAGPACAVHDAASVNPTAPDAAATAQFAHQAAAQAASRLPLAPTVRPEVTRLGSDSFDTTLRAILHQLKPVEEPSPPSL